MKMITARALLWSGFAAGLGMATAWGRSAGMPATAAMFQDSAVPDTVGGPGNVSTTTAISTADALPYFGAPDTLEAVVAGQGVVGPAPDGPLPSTTTGTAPSITTQPSSQSVTTGAAVTFTVTATGSPSPIYQWSKNGRFIRGANAASYTIAAAALTDAGAYTVEVYNGAGFATSAPATLSVANAGVVTAGPQSQAIATGATANFGVTAVGTALTYQWQFDGAPISGATTASLTVANAGPGAAGNYTVVVSAAGTRVAAEVATLAVTTNARLTNLSARGLVGTGGSDLIVGFVAGGTGTKQVLLRGVGPTLASAFNVTGALATPLLTLYGHNSQVLATNSSWGGTTALTQAFVSTGAFPLPPTSADAALLETLSPGPYTAIVTGVGTSSGIALAEIYDADTGTPTANLVNLSARAYVANGGSVLIAGFVVTGPSSETILIRGVGPTLKTGFGIFNALKNTQVTLYNAAGTQITANAGWGNDPWISGTSTQVNAFGFPPNSLDSALLVTIPPGAYTAEVTSTDGSTGEGMVEIYEVR